MNPIDEIISQRKMQAADQAKMEERKDHRVQIAYCEYILDMLEKGKHEVSSKTFFYVYSWKKEGISPDIYQLRELLNIYKIGITDIDHHTILFWTVYKFHLYFI